MRQSNLPLMEMPIFSLRLQWSFLLVNLVICISSFKLESHSSTPTFGNETDKLAFLAFKNYVVDVPNGVLSSWNDSLHFCQWEGLHAVTDFRGSQPWSWRIRVPCLLLGTQHFSESWTCPTIICTVPSQWYWLFTTDATSQSEHELYPRWDSDWTDKLLKLQNCEFHKEQSDRADSLALWPYVETANPEAWEEQSNRGYPIYFGKPFISSAAFSGGGGYSTWFKSSEVLEIFIFGCK